MIRLTAILIALTACADDVTINTCDSFAGWARATPEVQCTIGREDAAEADALTADGETPFILVPPNAMRTLITEDETGWTTAADRWDGTNGLLVRTKTPDQCAWIRCR